MEFSITARYRDCLSRQIVEALRISFSKDILLNSKGEYMCNTVSRLTIAEDVWERRERGRLEDEQEELDKRKVEEFKRMKTTFPGILPDTLPGGRADWTLPRQSLYWNWSRGKLLIYPQSRICWHPTKAD